MGAGAVNGIGVRACAVEAPRYNGEHEDTERMTIQVGDRAPDVTFGRSDGDEVSLDELWRDGPVVVAFLRHFG